MRINVELDSSNPGDMEKFFNLLSGFGTTPVVAASVDTVVEQSAPAAAEPVNDGPAVVEQPKRTRRTKAEMEAAKTADTDPDITRAYSREELLAAAGKAANPLASTPATQPATQAPPATEQPSAPISIDDLRAALQGYTSAKGMPAGIELLKKFGCSRISELAANDEGTKRGFMKDATV